MAGRSPILFVLLTVLIDTIGFGIIMPVLPELIMQIASVPLPDAARIGGYLMLVFAGLQFLFSPMMGNLSDRFGRRPVLLLSLLAFGANYALMGFATSLGTLFIGRALAGIAGAVHAPAMAFIADVTVPEKRAHSFGLISAAFGIGFVLGPAIGGLVGEFGPRAPFFVAASLAGLNFIYGMIVLPETLPPERRRPFQLARANPLGTLRAFRSERVVLALALSGFFWQLAFQVYPSTWSYYAIAKFDLSSGQIGMTLALAGISMAIVQSLLTGRVVARLGEARTARFSMIYTIGVFLAYAFARELALVYVVLAVSGLQGMAAPSLNSLMSRAIGPERQGELQGGLASVTGLATIVSPPILTQTLGYFSSPSAPLQFPGAAFVVAALFGLIALSLLIAQTRRL